MLHLNEDRRNSAWIDGTSARFEQTNEALSAETDALLSHFVGDTQLHPRLINTLSMLEHMGSHKIMATQHAAAIDQATLKHLAEESHHAYFMKRQAEKTAGRTLEYVAGDLVAPASARMYFQRLESQTVRLLGSATSRAAAYLYMSMIVEFRALWFYRRYQQVLKRARHAMSLKRLIGEEEHHLADMADRLEAAGELSDTRVDALVATETALYQKLLRAMQRAID